MTRSDLVGLRPHRLVYLGSPAEAVLPLEALVDNGYEIALVVTQPDRKRGRGGARQPSPVKAAAVARGLPVSHSVGDVLAAGADLGVVVAFGRLVKPDVLDALPMVNLHFSLLPRWRGAAPVERAILAGDTETGVCLMQLEEDLDTGPVFARVSTAIGPDETAAELKARLVALGTDLLLESLTVGLAEPQPQAGEPTYAAKLAAAEFALDWSRTGDELHRIVRAGSGRAFTSFRGRRVKVHRSRLLDVSDRSEGSADLEGLEPGELAGVRVGTGNGVLELVEVQPEGKPVIVARAWVNGARLQPGERLE